MAGISTLGMTAAHAANPNGRAFLGGLSKPLPKFKAAIARANAGGAPVRIMVSGHSFVSGSGSGSSDAGNHYANGCSGSAYSALLARRLTQLGLTTTWNSWCGDQNSRGVPLTLAQIDQRITLGTGWSADNSGSMLGDNVMAQAASGVGFLDFVPGFTFSTVRVWRMVNSGASEAVGVYADGVLVTTISQNGGDAYGYVDVTVPSGTAKISVRNNSTTKPAYITMVEAFPSSTTCLLTQNGWMGALSSNLILTGNPWQILPAQTAFLPDLLIIGSMFNDINGSIAASVWQAHTQTLIAACPTADVIIISDPLGFGQSSVTNDPYYAAATALRPASCVIDMRTTLGSTYAASNAAGYVSPDSTHPSSSGHARMASYAASRIMTAAGLTPTAISASVLGGAYANDASIDLNFATGNHYGGTLASLTSITRASSKTNLLPSSVSGFAYSTFGNNVLATTALGSALIEEARTNIFVSPTAPATQTINLAATGRYALWVNGSGSAAIAQNSATITGAGTATNGSPVIINCTATGTVNVTITGSPNTCQLEAGANATSFTTGARASDIWAPIGAFAALLAKWQGSILFACDGITQGVGVSFQTLLGSNSAQLLGQNGATTTSLRSADTSNANAMTATLGSGNMTSAFKAGLSWDKADRSLVGNGGTVGTNANGLIAAAMSSPVIGSTGGNFFINHGISRITMWDYRQYDPTWQALAT